MLKKIFIFLFVFTLFLYFLPSYVKAQEEFKVDSLVTYDVQENGKTVVTYDINLENLFSTIYATKYTLYLENIDVKNVYAYDENNKKLDTEIKRDGIKINIVITFNNAVVGKGAKRHFFISYENNSFATRTGEVWEISTPKLGDARSFNNFDLILSIPESFGSEAYISPSPKTKEVQNSKRIYRFSKSDISQTGITAGFGAFQVFNFTISYHLENPLPKNSEVEIAIPPDTSYQKIYYQKISPTPLNIRVDSDGNWLAKFLLNPRQRVDVVAVGTVQILSGPMQFPSPTKENLDENLKETTYWQVSDPQIKELASVLKTPEEIYNYVYKNLHYDYTRVQPNVQRLGALGALSAPNNAICMEFTDLFIAIARAAGIPAREVDGFAYTENPKLQPLSLVADVLHAWPEYYDKNKGVWVPIDPTWASTSGGVDYFNKLDLRHFTFVIHGSDSVKPYPPGSYKLGPNPQKDVYVAFGMLPENKNSILEINAKVLPNLPLVNSKLIIKIFNPGPSAVYNVYPSIYFDNSEYQRNYIQQLPPYSQKEIDLIMPHGILGSKTPDTIKITVGSSNSIIKTNKKQFIIESLLFLLFVLFLITLIILIKIRKISFNLFLDKINFYVHKFKIFNKNSNHQ